MRQTVLFFLFFVSFWAFSQEEIRCNHGGAVLTKEQQAEILKVEANLKNFRKANRRVEGQQIYTIPVVVHIVYKDETQNFTYDQVLKQIEVLNKDYRKLNSDTTLTPPAFKPFAADAGFEFKLAKRDPNGNPTTGVTYTKTTKSPFSSDTEEVKFTSSGGIDAWDPNSYLNIWVCDLTSGVLGYVPYPLVAGSSSDGVTIAYKAFSTYGGSLSSTYNLGRTATHEIGHWVNLLHPWGSPDQNGCTTDFVDDTPPQADYTKSSLNCPPNFYKPTQDTCNKTVFGRMWCDFLDYTRDRCMNMFSNGQVQRMTDYLVLYRPGILTSNALVPLYKNDLAAIEIHFDTSLGCSKSMVPPTVRISNEGSDTIKTFTVEFTINGRSQIETWYGVLAPAQDTLLGFPNYQPASNGDDPIEILAKVTLPASSADQNTQNDMCSFSCGQSSLGLYPNPADDYLYVKGSTERVRSTKVYDLSGKEVLSYANTQSMDVSTLVGGFYLVVFVTDQNKVRHQLIVVH
jgi:hypothetical protein